VGIHALPRVFAGDIAIGRTGEIVDAGSFDRGRTNVRNPCVGTAAQGAIEEESSSRNENGGAKLQFEATTCHAMIPAIINALGEPQIAAVARFFSSCVVREMARFGESPLFGRLLRDSTLPHYLSATQPIRNVFDFGLKLLGRGERRHEYVYKAAIARRILMGRHTLRTAVMLPEFRVGNCKADIVILNGTSAVYEIKSERDTLDRLQNQLAAYQSVFAQVNVIAGWKHIDEVAAIADEDVGLLTLSKHACISVLRRPRENVSRIVPSMVFQSLPLCESVRILRKLEFDVPDVPNTEIHREVSRLFAALDPFQLHPAMVQVLKATRNLAPLENFFENLPASLHAAVLSADLRQADKSRLVSAIDTPIADAMSWA